MKSLIFLKLARTFSISLATNSSALFPTGKRLISIACFVSCVVSVVDGDVEADVAVLALGVVDIVIFVVAAVAKGAVKSLSSVAAPML